MSDALKDIEYFQRQLTLSMSVPMNSFQKLTVTTTSSILAFENMGREMKKLSRAQNAMMRRALGFPPRSAVDRLADLADDL